jgi:hypothetical protein
LKFENKEKARKRFEMALEIVRNDDYIEYFLFPKLDQLPEGDEDDALAVLLAQINEISSTYTKNYIWHKDPFSLKARNSNSHLLNPESKGESCKKRVMKCSLTLVSFRRATSCSPLRHHVFRR